MTTNKMLDQIRNPSYFHFLLYFSTLLLSYLINNKHITMTDRDTIFGSHDIANIEIATKMKITPYQNL